MKRKNRELLGKIFALIVVLIMLVQIFLPLFNSIQIQQTAANVQTVDTGTIQTSGDNSITLNTANTLPSTTTSATK
ncbi:hypothetical protein IT412_01895 [Candidatus Peregrinibacteria bacterium]|nr:hypothetical protein [Candidatus Peregrinibacteria bacterium]